MTATPAKSWTTRLRECEAAAAAPATRLSWVRRAYARIFRFLIARYGDGMPEQPYGEPMPFGDATAALAGKAARSTGEIQHALKEIHAAQPEAAPAGKPQATPDTGWIVVASRPKRHELSASARQLAEQRIITRLRKQGATYTLLVPMESRADAFALLKTMRAPRWKAQLASPGAASRSRWQLALVGMVVIGAATTVALIVMGSSPAQDYGPIIGILAVIAGLTLAVVNGAFRGGR